MYALISPRYRMELIDNIHTRLWKLYESYKKVEYYLENWIEYEIDYSFENVPNFIIKKAYANNIDVLATLNNIDNKTLLKICLLFLFINAISPSFSTSHLLQLLFSNKSFIAT